jgi:nitrite reductase/ring-hydroxylating ferredoxin subunit
VSPVSPNRRQVLCGLVVALAAPGALAACGSPTATPAETPLAQVPVGGGTLVQGAHGPVLLTQPTAGVVTAYDAACPHQGTAVDPPVDGVITCPNHFSQFDAATGALRRGPATRGLSEVPVTVANGTVTVT